MSASLNQGRGPAVCARLCFRVGVGNVDTSVWGGAGKREICYRRHVLQIHGSYLCALSRGVFQLLGSMQCRPGGSLQSLSLCHSGGGEGQQLSLHGSQLQHSKRGRRAGTCFFGSRRVSLEGAKNRLRDGGKRWE